MTKTAEKINKLVQDIAIMRQNLDQLDAQLQDIAFTAEREVNPPDPEPLECWAWFKPSNPKAATYIHLSEDEAKKWSWPQRSDEGWTLLHVRQVTPQDEQDRKDAESFRRWKTTINERLTQVDKDAKDAALFRWVLGNALTGSIQITLEDPIYLTAADTENWRQLIKRAMERE